MTYADIAPLAKTLRQADVDEIRYSTGLPAETQLRILFQLPTKKDYTILGEDNLVLGGFGVTPSPMFTGVGIPWMVESDRLFQGHWRQFLRDARCWISVLGGGFEYLENYAR